MISLLSALLLSHMKNEEMIVSDCVETLREEREFGFRSAQDWQDGHFRQIGWRNEENELTGGYSG